MLVGVAAAIAVATIGRAHIGADFFDYLEWTKAFLTADVTQISSPVVSPEGYPLIQYHPGTGALFALPKLVAPSIPLRVSAYLAAGAATRWNAWSKPAWTPESAPHAPSPRRRRRSTPTTR